MKSVNEKSLLSRPRALRAALVLLAVCLVAGAYADDRDLLRRSAGEPYVFIIMDTSGSMSWTPPCNHIDAASDGDPFDGKCTFSCPMDDATCAQVCPNQGCVEYSKSSMPDLDSPALQPIVIDDSDSGFSANTNQSGHGKSTNYKFYRTGSDTWSNTGFTGDPAGDFAHILPASRKGTYTFARNLPAAGLYHVYAYWYTNDDSTRNTTYSKETRFGVRYYDGATMRKKYSEIDQQVGNIFTFIGTFDFRQNPSGAVPGEVFVTNVDDLNNVVVNGSIIADAVAFVPVPPKPATAVCEEVDYRCQQPLCPEGDCQPPNSADDVTSKFFQAKQAMYEVLEKIDNVHFGFASYEQDDPLVRFKHWQYRIANSQGPIFNFPDGASATIPFPEPGRWDMFGTGPPYDINGRNITSPTTGYDENGFHCATSTTSTENDHYIGCRSNQPADVNDLWEMERLRVIPKLGRTGLQETSLYVRAWTGTEYRTYRIDWESVDEDYDYGEGLLVVHMDVIWCKNITTDPQCNSSSSSVAEKLVENAEVRYRLMSDNAPVHLTLKRFPMAGNGFFDNQEGVYADRTCNGLEENNDWKYDVCPYKGGTGTGCLTSPTISATSSDADDDAFGGYSFKRPWVLDSRGWFNVAGGALTNSTRTNIFDHGDFIPFDWLADNNKEIRTYLAPNTIDSGADPDYRVVTYFQDRTWNTTGDPDRVLRSDRKLRLKDDLDFSNTGSDPDDADDDVYVADTALANKRRPLVSWGSTPIYKSVQQFRSWYTDWVKYAKVRDPDWQCRAKYLLFLTDGDETCDQGPPLPICAASNDVLYLSSSLAVEDRVKTYVVGFGLPGGGDALTCMARDGKTGPGGTAGTPILPRNKDELVAALTNIFTSIRAQAFAFASASIPAVQSTAADKIFLSSFTPIQGSSVWPGRLDAYRQPLPLTAAGRPDVSYKCDADAEIESGCHLWDAADKLLGQAPGVDDVQSSPPNFKLGMNFASQRRILYGRNNPSGARQAMRLLIPPAENGYTGWTADRLDLAKVLMEPLDYTKYAGNLMTQADALAKMEQVIGEMVVKKEQTIPADPLFASFGCTGDTLVPLGSTSFECEFVMGDIFHANPTVITGPSNFNFFKQDLCGKKPALPSGAPTPPPDPIPNNCDIERGSLIDRGYREYTARNVWRRRMLLAATNDAQLHFFDAGVYTQVNTSPASTEKVDVFTDGTGLELFAYAPRLTLPALREQALKSKHVYSLDGSVTVADVFIDPVNQPAVSREREWRTILVGGVREAGDVFSQTAHVNDISGGYFAIDITQPDQYDNPSGPPRVPAKNLGLPTCLKLDSASGHQGNVPGCETLNGKSTLFPLELWSFKDEIRIGGVPYLLDDNVNLVKDLGATWSQPVIGQITVCKPTATDCSTVGNLTTRWVAIFGGGNDPDQGNKSNPQQGTYIYMVDVETGETIYKRQLIGAAVADPAVLDLDEDGIFDVIYQGTTKGFLYKIDLRKRNGNQVPKVVTQNLPVLAAMGYTPSPGQTTVSVQRITDAAWEPFKILFTGTTATSNDGPPIYFAPAMFKIPELNYYGGLLLVGDREELWENPPSPPQIRVYTFVDENFTSESVVLASQLQNIDYKAVAPLTSDYLRFPNTGKKRGWVLTGLPVDWRATGEPFLVAGVAIFSLFDPLVEQSTQNGVKVCQRKGETRGFALFVKNGNPLAPDLPNIQNECVGVDDLCCGGRCFMIDEFTTAIHTTSTVSKNRPPKERTDGGSHYGQEELVTGAAQAAMLDAIRDAIIDSMPSSCQYNEKYEISFAVLRNSTGLNELARVPMMVCPGDWKD